MKTIGSVLGIALGLALTVTPAAVLAAGPGVAAGPNIAEATVGEGFVASEDEDAVATSEAGVEVAPGTLTLDAVPHFYFAPVNTRSLIENDATALVW